jgi:hypothetical protein
MQHDLALGVEYAQVNRPPVQVDAAGVKEWERA